MSKFIKFSDGDFINLGNVEQVIKFCAEKNIRGIKILFTSGNRETFYGEDRIIILDAIEDLIKKEETVK